MLDNCGWNINEQLNEVSFNLTESRALPGFHWRCPDCGFFNGGWRNNCYECGEEYESNHGDLLLSIVLLESHLI